MKLVRALDGSMVALVNVKRIRVEEPAKEGYVNDRLRDLVGRTKHSEQGFDGGRPAVVVSFFDERKDVAVSTHDDVPEAHAALGLLADWISE